MSVELGESKKKKPEKMEFCNKSKCGLDVADQMARQYSVKAGTHWWPMLFSTTFWIWQEPMHLCSIKKTGDKVSRQDFLFKLVTELREDYIVED